MPELDRAASKQLGEMAQKCEAHAATFVNCVLRGAIGARLKSTATGGAVGPRQEDVNDLIRPGPGPHARTHTDMSVHPTNTSMHRSSPRITSRKTA